ncbi:uncharacterized protein CEXT_496341 [Caerostris extrusa]|uniref:Uncharacterized protein n=1 Tax=Caerostris extrusa TaxID=172846 RepID=A0AAV4VJB0_CAEEX|nr:uncharacterized protein CEXT_496341 [Caerostris extrusa]
MISAHANAQRRYDCEHVSSDTVIQAPRDSPIVLHSLVKPCPDKRTRGVTGPHAYKFGYNTGDPENPMARYEERTPDGLVKGSYSYVDPMGKLQVVHYESHPERGFKTTHG